VLSQTANYALRAMGYLASREGERPIRAQVIAEAMDIPPTFLSKIMHQLARAGLVVSVRGTNGGFQPARPAAEITLREVVAPFMDLAVYRQCFLGRTECDGTCGIHRQWQPIMERFDALLTNTTIDQII